MFRSIILLVSVFVLTACNGCTSPSSTDAAVEVADVAVVEASASDVVTPSSDVSASSDATVAPSDVVAVSDVAATDASAVEVSVSSDVVVSPVDATRDVTVVRD